MINYNKILLNVFELLSNTESTLLSTFTDVIETVEIKACLFFAVFVSEPNYHYFFNVSFECYLLGKSNTQI